MNPAQAGAFYDLQGLASLRAQAASTPRSATREVASQFEALFVQMMVKSMRDATIDGGLFGSHQMDFYQSMFDQQMSLHLSRQSSLGLSDILVEQLDGGAAAAPREEDAQGLSQLGVLSGSGNTAAAPATAGPAPQAPAAANDQAVPAQAGPPVSAGDSDWRPGSPAEYIRSVWDHAVDAAGRIGLDPLVLVAQSALETGWGRKVIQAVDGRSSFNLFGIKAGGGWNGESAAVNTLEYRDGIAALERASFRVYDSLRDSFDDYVDFL
ncbi:MAG: flagellar assembly peptidoglycan hydrolase FlgJ, partial [Halioglobus sp.]|nr:flagellar assembly peptidoglycan hydrolase FlgJ [Halioglobus sp.]